MFLRRSMQNKAGRQTWTWPPMEADKNSGSNKLRLQKAKSKFKAHGAGCRALKSQDSHSSYITIINRRDNHAWNNRLDSVSNIELHIAVLKTFFNEVLDSKWVSTILFHLLYTSASKQRQKKSSCNRYLLDLVRSQRCWSSRQAMNCKRMLCLVALWTQMVEQRINSEV